MKLRNAAATSEYPIPSPDDTFPFKIGEAKWTLTDAQRREHGWGFPVETDFALSFNDGSCFTDKKYRSMLELIQRHLATYWRGKSKGRVLGDWRRLVPFVKFCVDTRGISNFSNMWGVDLYIAHIKQRRRRTAGGATEKSGAMTAAALQKYLDPVKQLWSFSHDKPDGLRVEPWSGRTSGNAAGVKWTGANRVLPYELWEFAGLVRISMEEIAQVDDLCFLLTQDVSSQIKLVKLVRFRTAVQIIIFSLGSLRPDEVLALKRTCITEGKLKTTDGIVGVTWLEGKIFKDQPPGGTPHRWLAADEIRIACDSMNKLWDTLTKCLQDKIFPPYYSEAIENSKEYLLPKFAGKELSPSLTSDASYLALKTFCREERCSSFMGSCVVTQKRFRPTLARAFARLELGDVTYFMHHWGQRRWRTANGYFLTFADEGFQRDVTDSVRGEKEHLLRDILSSRSPLLGKRGAQIEPVRRSFATMTFEKQQDVVRHIARGHEIRIGPQSLCMAANGTKLCPQDCLYEETRCLDCHNGVIAALHLDVWKDMELRTLQLNGEFHESSPAYEALSKNLVDIQETIRILEKNKVDE
jgi:hypothetical protein